MILKMAILKNLLIKIARYGNMMKDVTIITFDEMEMIRQDLDNMIDNAKDGAYGNRNEHAKIVCEELIEDLKRFRSQFE